MDSHCLGQSSHILPEGNSTNTTRRLQGFGGPYDIPVPSHIALPVCDKVGRDVEACMYSPISKPHGTAEVGKLVRMPGRCANEDI